jgi:hypothetical protein
VKTDGLRVRPEEGGVIAVSKTPGPNLIGIFAVGLPHLMLLPLLRVETKGQKVVGTVAHKEAGCPWGAPTNMGFSGILRFSLHLEAAATLATVTLHA